MLEELPVRRVDPLIEDDAVNGSEGINMDGHGHGVRIAEKGWKSSRAVAGIRAKISLSQKFEMTWALYV